MSHKNFAITAMGGSGTTWLSWLLNRSKVWTVRHEPTKKATLDQIQRRFERDHYGEVNSYLRCHFGDLKVAKKGLILRPVRDIIWSWAEHRRELSEEWWDELNHTLQAFHQFADEDVQLISFERMTTDVDYVQQLAGDFGVDDISVKVSDLDRKMNRHRKGTHERFEDLPCAKRYAQFAWFDTFLRDLGLWTSPLP